MAASTGEGFGIASQPSILAHLPSIPQIRPLCTVGLAKPTFLQTPIQESAFSGPSMAERVGKLLRRRTRPEYLLMPMDQPGLVYDMNDGGMDGSMDGGLTWSNRSKGWL